jgi:hypothetical protein
MPRLTIPEARENANPVLTDYPVNHFIAALISSLIKSQKKGDEGIPFVAVTTEESMKHAVVHNRHDLVRFLGVNFTMVVLSNHPLELCRGPEPPSPGRTFWLAEFYNDAIREICSQYGVISYPPMEGFDIITNTEIHDMPLHQEGLKLPYCRLCLPVTDSEDMTLQELGNMVANAENDTTFMHKDRSIQRKLGAWEFIRRNGMIAKPLTHVCQGCFGVLIYQYLGNERWLIKDINGRSVPVNSSVDEFITGTFGDKPVTYHFEPYILTARFNKYCIVGYQKKAGQVVTLYTSKTKFLLNGTFEMGDPWQTSSSHKFLNGWPGWVMKAL